jgi:clan AA aspartic protease
MKLNRRLIHVWAGIPLKEEDMGEVRVKIRVTNTRDFLNARDGIIPSDQVRSAEVEAVIDTGAVQCVIPQSLADQIGLGRIATRNVMLADGRTLEAPVADPVTLELLGRNATEDCLIMGNEVLIGQTALETTDLFVDCVNGKLVPNPDHPNSAILHIR